MNPNDQEFRVMDMVMICILVAVGVISLVGNVGCDNLVNYDNVASWGGLVDPWYTSAMGLPAYNSGYDATGTIQSVIDYRQDAMDWSNAAWDDYIMQ